MTTGEVVSLAFIPVGVFIGYAYGFLSGLATGKVRRPQQPTPADLDAAARAFWIEAEKAHAVNHVERNGHG